MHAKAFLASRWDQAGDAVHVCAVLHIPAVSSWLPSLPWAHWARHMQQESLNVLRGGREELAPALL